MPTVRGFVEKLGIGRAGLVEADVMDINNDVATYTIADLDADPERFNERLSKLAILRDAMDRAEPVEIDFLQDDNGGRSIDAVMRITRDALRRSQEAAITQGIIVALGVNQEILAQSNREAPDRAAMFILDGSDLVFCQINLQGPERGTAAAMFDMASEAYAVGDQVTVSYDAETFDVRDIVRQRAQGFINSEQQPIFSAFVEEIGHTQTANLVRVDVTTAPEFQGDGNVVPLAPFEPERRSLAVIYQSPEYYLLEAALRDKLRVELLTSRLRDREDGDDNPNDDVPAGDAVPASDIGRFDMEGLASAMSRTGTASLAAERRPSAIRDAGFYMLRGAILQHALCSATRPVWIEINRRALDVGPDAECIEGLPSNDMRPQTLRELNLPYRAAWHGHGCFNHGVYRFQIETDRDLTILVDDEEICLHADDDMTAVFGHACLEGDHHVQIIFENWQCSANFDIDVYRIR